LHPFTPLAQVSCFPHTENFEKLSSYQGAKQVAIFAVAGPNIPGKSADPSDDIDPYMVDIKSAPQFVHSEAVD
jgi:hypothetical protein